MDADEFRPHFGQFTRLWNKFKKDYYEWFRKYYISHYTEHYRKPVPCSFDIDQYVFDPFFKHKQAKELKSTESYWLKSDLDYGLKDLILWEERVVSFINNIQRDRVIFYKLLADDYTEPQWGGELFIAK